MTSFNARFSRLRSANICLSRRFSSSRSFIFYIGGVHPTVLCFPVIVRGLRYPRFAADILEGMSGFDRLQNDDDLVPSESGFAHNDLLRGHNQYVVRSLKVNGSFKRDAYMTASDLIFRLYV